MNTVELPIRTVNSLNEREHWAVRARRAKKERRIAYCVTPAGLSLPLTVKLTRFGKNKRPMDDDGLSASFKNIRDGIADKCNVDDGNPGLVFEYSQEKSKSYAVRIEFGSREGWG